MNDIKMETERLIIRRFKAGDWQDLYDYLSKEEVVKFEPYEVYDEEGSKGEAIRRSTDDTFYAVVLKENNKVIGNVYFGKEGPDDFRTMEIGYVFNSDYWNHGYATEACKRIMEYGFNDLKAHRIIAMCNPVNSASWHLMERLNMRREATLKKNVFFNLDKDGSPIWQDTYMYGILPKEMK